MRSFEAAFVDKVDRFVGQEPVGDVAVRQEGRRHERRSFNRHAWWNLVALPEPSQDADRVSTVG